MQDNINILLENGYLYIRNNRKIIARFTHVRYSSKERGQKLINYLSRRRYMTQKALEDVARMLWHVWGVAVDCPVIARKCP